jgi:hypothetical protein
MLLPTRERMLFQEHTPVPVWVAPSPILLRLRLVDARYALLPLASPPHHSEKAHAR